MSKLKTGWQFIYLVPKHKDKNMAFVGGISLIHCGHHIYATFNMK